jgi:hypothetical protein
VLALPAAFLLPDASTRRGIPILLAVGALLVIGVGFIINGALQRRRWNRSSSDPEPTTNSRADSADEYAESAPDNYPGQTLGIMGLVLSVLASVVGLLLSVTALYQSRQAGIHNRPAVAGIVVGIITTVASITVVWLYAVGAMPI